MKPRDGQRVAYVGHVTPTSPVLGEIGVVLDAGRTGSHIQWSGAGVMLTSNDHLAPSTDERFEVMSSALDGSLLGFDPMDAFERGGKTAVINRLHKQGHLDYLHRAIAREAILWASDLVGQDPSVRQAADSLPEDQRDDFVIALAKVLLRRVNVA